MPKKMQMPLSLSLKTQVLQQQVQVQTEPNIHTGQLFSATSWLQFSFWKLSTKIFDWGDNFRVMLYQYFYEHKKCNNI